MKKIMLLILFSISCRSIAAEENCDGLLPLDRVKEICGKEFIHSKSSNREKRCTANYIDKAMGKKYVGEVGISSELIVKKNHRISKKGKNAAGVSFQSSLDGAKQRGIYKQDVADLGEGAYYSELDIHQTVTWYKGEYLCDFTVDKGKLNEGNWEAPCTPEQTIELAKAIDCK